MSNFTTDAVRAYLQEIGRFRLLTAEEELGLARQIQAGLLQRERKPAAQDQAVVQSGDRSIPIVGR